MRIGLVEPRWGAYVTLLSVASFGLGASALLGVLALVEVGAPWWGSQAGILLLVQWVFTGVLVPLTLLVRRRIRRLPRTVQWGLALIVLAAVLSMSGSIIILFDG